MILVTGGTGFLGAYIIRHLVEQGVEVRAIRRQNRSLPLFINESVWNKVHWVEGDVLDVVSLQDAMEGVQAVIHAAAKVSFISDEKDEMLKINVEGTANVMNIAVEKNIQRVIHISSVAAMGRTANGETVNEEREWKETKLNTNYAISKYKGEMEVWRAIGEGLNAVIVNPSTILGYGDWNNSSCAIFKSVHDRFPYYTNGINGFVYVEDVARVIVLLLKSSIRGERFITNGDNWSFRQLLNTMADGFNQKHPHLHANAALAGVAWRWEKLKTMFTGKRSVLTKESARIAQTKTFFDNNKILQYLPGFSFTPLEEAVHKSCAQYLRNVLTTRL